MTKAFLDDTERSLALQKYMNLQDRQQSIRRRLSSSSSSSSGSSSNPTTSPTNTLHPWLTTSDPRTTTTTTTSTIPSPPRSPTGTRPRNHIRGGRSARSSRSSPPLAHDILSARRRLSLPSAAALLCSEDAIDDCPLDAPVPTAAASAEADLLELNNDIKATLTTLLNLPSVRRDERGEMRAWVQERLMDAEMEIRRLRRGCRGGVALVQ